MNSDKLSRWLSILANASVLAGILFLAIEINQNNDLLESEARNSRAQNRIQGNFQIIGSPILISAFLSNGEGVELSGEERFALQRFVISNLVSWQLAYEDYQAGLLEIEDLPILGWRNAMQGTAYRDVWEDFAQANMRPDFIAWFNEVVIEG